MYFINSKYLNGFIIPILAPPKNTKMEWNIRLDNKEIRIQYGFSL